MSAALTHRDDAGRAAREEPAAPRTTAASPKEGLPAAVHIRLAERRLLLLLGDAAISTLALALATLPRGWASLPGSKPLWWLVVLWVVELLVARASDADDPGKAANPFAGSYASIRAWTVIVLLYLAVPYLSAPLLHSRASVAVFYWSGLLLRLAWRSGYALLMSHPRFVTRIAIVGNGPAAARMAEAIRTHLGRDHVVLGCIVADAAGAASVAGAQEVEPAAAPPLAVLGGPEALDDLLGLGLVSTLILTGGALPAALYSRVMRAYEAGVRVVPMPVYYEAVTGRVPVEHVGDYWYVSLPRMEYDWLYGLVKRGFDIVGALAGLTLVALLFPFIALAVRLSGPGPIFYTQRRLGLRGRPFTVWKFRTMVTNAEQNGQAQWAKPDDPRVTRVGRFLRRCHLDELPQLWNVLRGEMSLVGPRPERPEFVALLEQQIPLYRVRLLARPGLTGWAQVKQPHASTVADTVRKLEYDLYYLAHRSLYLDLLILLKTLSVALRLRGI